MPQAGHAASYCKWPYYDEHISSYFRLTFMSNLQQFGELGKRVYPKRVPENPL